ncbi:MAG: hypothetical protein Q9166_004427 [cf. Caloplaca sp. 2 TL-2023]
MSTASKWFVSDAEYYASTEDYAIVGEKAAWVDSFLLSGRTNHGYDYLDEERASTFADILHYPVGDPECPGCQVSDRLVYADVDCDNKEHQRLCKDVAKQGFLEQEDEKTKEARKKLFAYMNTSHRRRYKTDNENSVEEEIPESEKEYGVARTKDIFNRTGSISKKMIDYTIGVEDADSRRDLLTVLSRQQLRKMQRPVMILIGAVDKQMFGFQEGWIAGYNFYDERIIIKPYSANLSQHVLSQKWDVELPDDGISFTGRPSAFVGKLLELHADIENKKPDNEDDPEMYGYKLLTYQCVAKWVLSHWKALASIKQVDGDAPMTEESYEKIHDLLDAIYQTAVKIPLPHKEPKASASTQGSMQTLLDMQMMLADFEATVRLEAIEAKDAGKETVAENAAKLYGQISEQLQSFNLDPEKPL